MRGKLNSKVPESAKPKGKPRGGSRKGRPNKATKALKDMILGALNDAGGQAYLAGQAKTNPNAFLALIGKVLPTTINAKVASGSMTPEEADAVVDEVMGAEA